MNIVECVRKREAEFSTCTALIDGATRRSYGEMYDRVDRLSNAFIEMGLEKGRVLMAWLPNCHQAIETELACLQVGGVWLTLNAGMMWPEVQGVMASTAPVVVVTTPELYALMAGHGGAFKTVLVSDSSESAGPEDYESIIESSSPERPAVDVGEDDIARLRYTSGTTGRAKAAVLPQSAYLASLRNQQNELHALDTGDRVLHAAPLTHASAALMYPILAAGGANVVVPRFDVDLVFETIERERITTMFMVPTILQRLSEAPDFRTRDLSSLRTVTYGGAPTSVSKIEAVLDVLGGTLVQIYGLTEALHPVTTLKREEHYPGNPRLASVGKPTRINDVEIRSESGGERLPGEVGEIWVRGPNVMAGYWKDEAETRAVLKEGWLATGDLAYRDEDGYIFIVDRKKDVIISGGFNVYSKEVEVALCEHESVSEAAIVGVPHPEWGEVVVAYLVASDSVSPDEEEVARWCRERLSNYKRPKRIHFVSEFPRTSSGKIDKKALVRLG